MKVFRIYITSWTASFRYPNLISGFQPTLPVPPLSTIYGMISSAMGHYYTPESIELGYSFRTFGKAVDLETIYQMEDSVKNVKSNVIRREFLFDNHLWIYTKKKEIADSFKEPFFQILLGRTGDLATINEVVEIEVEPCTQLSKLKGTIVPFGKYILAAPISALPVYFSDTIPRRNVGTKPYYLLESNYRQSQGIKATGIIDYSNKYFNQDDGLQIYWQE